MSDRIYSDDESFARENIALVAQACHGVLTKRYLTNNTVVSYDKVKHFNFFEYNIWSLSELYNLSKLLLNKPRCCLIRAKLKDRNRRRNMLRRAYDREDGSEATLLQDRFNWFAMDIDGYGLSLNNLFTDTHQVLLALGEGFQDTECFAVASASYGVKPAVHMRLFFWSQEAVSNLDLFRALKNNRANVDTSLYSNPVQPIYCAAPLFEGGLTDPIKQRIMWISGQFSSVIIPSSPEHGKGMAEVVYTKQEADAFITKQLTLLSRLAPGDRHTGLWNIGVFLGKLVGQNHFERNEVIDRAFNHCSFWRGKRDTRKDLATITDAVDHGIRSMEETND
jgi:hypothetical protein